MFDQLDETFYVRRIEEELRKAENSANPNVARVHQELAHEYMIKVRQSVPASNIN